MTFLSRMTFLLYKIENMNIKHLRAISEVLFLIYRELEQSIFCKKYKKMVSIIEDKWDGNNWNW